MERVTGMPENPMGLNRFRSEIVEGLEQSTVRAESGGRHG